MKVSLETLVMPINYPKWGLIITVVGSVAAILVVPEVRSFIGLKSEERSIQPPTLQQVSLTVRAETGEALEGVKVEVVGQGPPEVSHTDKSGYVKVKILSRGEAKVFLTKSGYLSENFSVNLETDQNTVREIRLSKSAGSPNIIPPPLSLSPTPQLVDLGTPNSAKDYGQEKVTCSMLNGILTMSILERTGRYAMCCGDYNPVVAVKINDEFSANVELQEAEQQFDIKVETVEGSHILLHNKALDKGSFSKKHSFVASDFRGKDSENVSRFCIAAVGSGRLQTVKARVELRGKR